MNSKPIIILGNGGHAQVLTEIILQKKGTIFGYTTPAESENKYNLNYLGNDDIISKYDPNEIYLVNGVGSAESLNLRKRLFSLFKQKGFNFLTLAHEQSIISKHAIISEGAQIMAGSVIQPFSHVGDNVIINTRASIDHECNIGNHSHIAPGTVLCGNVSVGEKSFIGANATVIQNINIGSNCLIGAGSLVNRNINSNKKCFGVPIKEVTE